MSKKYKLPKEFAEKWVTALRSGEYKQTKGRLCNGNSHYCCLGIAGLVLGIIQSRLILKANKKLSSLAFGVPVPFVHKAGEPDLQAELIQLNDYKDKSFPEIADWIEQNVEFI